MDNLRKAAEMALEALERGTTGLAIRAIPALRQALAQPEQESGKCACGANLYIDENGKPCSKAQPEQEPVAWIVTTKNVEQKVCWVFNSQEEAMLWSAKHLKIGVIKPLYTAPVSKPWVSLTDEEMQGIKGQWVVGEISFDDYCNAIEAALRSKNT